MATTAGAGEQHAAEATSATDAGRMPAAVRRAVLVALAVLLVGAAGLIWLRGESILVDISTLAGKAWCF